MPCKVQCVMQQVCGAADEISPSIDRARAQELQLSPSTAQSSAHPGRLRTYTSSTVSNDQLLQQPCPCSRQSGCCVWCAGWGRSWRPRPRPLTTQSCCRSWSKSEKCQRPSVPARSVQTNKWFLTQKVDCEILADWSISVILCQSRSIKVKQGPFWSILLTLL